MGDFNKIAPPARTPDKVIDFTKPFPATYAPASQGDNVGPIRRVIGRQRMWRCVTPPPPEGSFHDSTWRLLSTPDDPEIGDVPGTDLVFPVAVRSA